MEKESKPPEAGPKDKDQVNLTDEASRIMPTASGFELAYNAQAAVTTDTMRVITAHVTRQPNDKQQIEAVLEALQTLPEAMGKTQTLLADNGYLSEASVKACVEKAIDPLIALGREAHHLPLAARFQPDAAIAEPAAA